MEFVWPTDLEILRFSDALKSKINWRISKMVNTTKPGSAKTTEMNIIPVRIPKHPDTSAIGPISFCQPIKPMPNIK